MDPVACEVCFNTYGEEIEMIPKILDCGHTICITCLKTIHATHRKCPKCRSSMMKFHVNDYPTNFLALSVCQHLNNFNLSEWDIKGQINMDLLTLTQLNESLKKDIDDKSEQRMRVSASIKILEELSRKNYKDLHVKETADLLENLKQDITSVQKVNSALILPLISAFKLTARDIIGSRSSFTSVLEALWSLMIGTTDKKITNACMEALINLTSQSEVIVEHGNWWNRCLDDLSKNTNNNGLTIIAFLSKMLECHQCEEGASNMVEMSLRDSDCKALQNALLENLKVYMRNTKTLVDEYTRNKIDISKIRESHADEVQERLKFLKIILEKQLIELHEFDWFTPIWSCLVTNGVSEDDLDALFDFLANLDIGIASGVREKHFNEYISKREPYSVTEKFMKCFRHYYITILEEKLCNQGQWCYRTYGDIVGTNYLLWIIVLGNKRCSEIATKIVKEAIILLQQAKIGNSKEIATHLNEKLNMICRLPESTKKPLQRERAWQ